MENENFLAKKSEKPRNWYIAIVSNNTERASAEKLKRDYEVFLPSQQYVSIWKDGRRKVRERILLPGKLLIRCTEAERQQTMNYSFVKRYMVDIASAPNEFGRRKVAIVPDDQVERLRFVVGQSEIPVTIDNENLQPGEKVRILRGSLQGLEAEVIMVYNTQLPTPNSHLKVFLRIEHLGCAKIQISLEDLERI